MKLTIGNNYNGYIYAGMVEGDYTCDVCQHRHYTNHLPLLHWFNNINDADNLIKIGTSCIKTRNYYTVLLGIINGKRRY